MVKVLLGSLPCHLVSIDSNTFTACQHIIMYHIISGELRMTYLEKPYTLCGSAHHISVLLAFNASLCHSIRYGHVQGTRHDSESHQ